MLILNLKTAKHPQQITLSAYYLNSDTNHSQWPCLSLENWKLSTNFYVITKKNGKNENRQH